MIIKAPDIAVIAWIPYATSLRKLPKGHAFEIDRLRGPLAMRLLFNSGNPKPPDHFAGRDEMVDWLNRGKEFRAAAWFQNVSLDPAIPDDISHEFEFLPGYTPPRLVVFSRNLVPKRYDLGLCDAPEASIRALPGGRGAELRQRIDFKLGEKMDRYQSCLTGSLAPSLWFEVRYTIRTDGTVSTHFFSTAVPNLSIYQDWSLVRVENMLQSNTDEVNGFLRTPGCTNAPLVRRWPSL